MHGPGTIAVAVGAARFEAEQAHRTLTTGAGQALPATPSPTMATPETGRLVVPVSDRARELPCTTDPDLFFAESPEDVEYAKVICGRCRVRTACLSGAIARREPWGVWGGELFLRGEIVPRKRPRGRPRKTDIAA